MTNTTRQDVLDYLMETFCPSGLGSKRDFQTEERCFCDSALALKLWVACVHDGRWQEFGFEETYDIRAPGDPYFGLRKSAPLDLLAKCKKAKRTMNLEEALKNVDAESVLRESLFPAPYNLREIRWSDKTGNRYICYQVSPRLYLPCWGIKSPDRASIVPIFKPIKPCLYLSNPTNSKTVFLTDDLICAQQNRIRANAEFGWCSFYSRDGGSDGVDFSPLNGKHVIFIVYPRKGVPDRQQLESAENIRKKLENYGVEHVSFAVYVDGSQTNSTALRLEPLLVKSEELHTLLDATEHPSKIPLIPAWATSFFPITPREITVHPDIKANSTIVLTGGLQTVQLAFLAAFLGSLVKSEALLPGIKCLNPGRVLGFISEKALPELRTWLVHYGIPVATKMLDWADLNEAGDQLSALIRLLPISADSPPELQWQPSSRFLDQRLDEMSDTGNTLPVQLLVLDCNALEHKLSKSLAIIAEFSDYIHALSVRGIAVVLLASSHSWLTRSLNQAEKWMICDEITSVTGVSFTLCCTGMKKSNLPYRLFLRPRLSWKRGKAPSLEEQKRKVRLLYEKNRKKPFGSGQGHELTIQDIVNATGYGESQVKKLRRLLGFARKCPQRGKRKSDIN